jgi:polysaccharide biosynthesis/export protein
MSRLMRLCAPLVVAAVGQCLAQAPRQDQARLDSAAAMSVKTAAAKPDRGAPEDYEIGAGDTLGVFVWKEPDASVPSVVVRPDGKIALPLLKDVAVAGLTPRAAEQRITEGLSKLIVSGVDVTVVVTAINSKKIYVMGAVKREGTIPYSYRMTVMQALGEAGGLNDFAKRKKIYVLRGAGQKQSRYPFNYDDVIRGMNMMQNIELLPGDTIVIPH